MDDFPNISNKQLKKLQLNTIVSRKNIVHKYQKTIKRRNRRKRSKKAYLKYLHKRRQGTVTEDLCVGLENFNVIDMEMTPLCDINKLPEEITEWQKQDQIAYWKSRAITLEIENQMLQEHLRNAYAQQIEYYEKSRDWKEVQISECSENKTSSTDSQSQCKHSIKAGSSKESDISDKMKDIGKVLPKLPDGKNRLDEMKKIYGDMAQKIMGMETAIQLNYEKFKEKDKAMYWPNIGLKI